MPILTSTVLFYVVAAVVVAVAATLVRRDRAAGTVILWSSLGIALAVPVLATMFREGPFGSMRLAAHGLFGIAPSTLILVVLLAGTTGRRVAAAVLAAFLWAFAFWAFRIEPRFLEITRHVVPSEAVSAPVRIVVLADLQTDRVGEHEREALREIAALEPDLLLLSGDYLQVFGEAAHRREADRLREAWRSLDLDPPLGAWAVAGNTDPEGLWREIFEGISVRSLEETTTVRLGEMSLTGLSVADSADPQLHVGEAPGLHVVFGHYPDYALGRIEADLLLAGHTHGGQVRLPGIGPLLKFSEVPRSWAAGRTDLERGRTLVVSRGVGMERGAAPRMRFLCRPELVVVDLVPSSG